MPGRLQSIHPWHVYIHQDHIRLAALCELHSFLPVHGFTDNLGLPRALGFEEAPAPLLDYFGGMVFSGGLVTCLVVDPTTAAVQMASHMHEMVKQIRAGVPPATQHLETPEFVEWASRFFRESNVNDVFVILNRIRDGAMERLVRGKLAEKAIEPIGVIVVDPLGQR